MVNTAFIIASNATVIHPERFEPIRESSFVYFKTDNVEYPLIKDKEFGISASAAILSRKVRYCQWVEEGFDSSDKSVRTRRYFKAWVSKPINSQEFMDARYFNPMNTSLPDRLYTSNVTVGFYSLSQRLFNVKENEYQDLTLEDDLIDNVALLPSFNQSFEYVGNGYFYYYYNKTAEKIKKFDKCTPGDVRVKISVYAPKKLSVLGYLENTTIDTKDVKNMMMGSAKGGSISPEHLLSSPHMFRKKIALVSRFITFISSLILIIDRSTSAEARIWNFSMFAILVFSVRSLMWNNRFFNPYYWFSILIGAACVYTTREEQFVTFD